MYAAQQYPFDAPHCFQVIIDPWIGYCIKNAGAPRRCCHQAWSPAWDPLGGAPWATTLLLRTVCNDSL
jgi:hypothetical protein